MANLLSNARFRLGTTSYIIPEDILPNVRYLASKVRDIELVLFELDDGPNNLPTSEQAAELNALAAQHDLTYTVHLPLDLRLGADGSEQHVSLVKARRVIEAARPLNPRAYVLHLDGREVREQLTAGALALWQDQSVRALEIVSAWAGSVNLLAVENLEGYPLDFLDAMMERVPVSRCVDIGHLWLDGHDPLPYLQRWLPRTRVIHIHGIAGRDHKSLAHISRAQRDPVLRYLAGQYEGVLTLEVFQEEDLRTSLLAMEESLA